MTVSGLPLRRSLLVNDFEIEIDQQLAAVCARYGTRVLPKVGIREVIDRTGLVDRGDRDYAFNAHFDFVVIDAAGDAILVVEFDGPRHLTDSKTTARDERKNRICRQAFLPLLRVTASGLRHADHRTLLGWLVEVLLEEHRLHQQQRAYVDSDGETDPPDADPDSFRYQDAVTRDDDGMRPVVPMDCFDAARQQILRFITARFEREYPRFFTDYEGSKHRASRGLVALQVKPGRWLTGSAAVSLAGLIYPRGGLAGPIVAQDVAVLDLTRQLEHRQRHDSPTLDDLTLQKEVRGLKEQALTHLGVLSDAERKLMILEQFGVQAFLADLRQDDDLDY